MEKLKYRFSLLAIMVLVVSSCSIKEGLTDEEVLTLDQTNWNYTVELFDPYLKKGIAGATLKVTINGEAKTLTANELGTVEFTGSYNEELFVNVSKEGYHGFGTTVYFDDTNRSKSLKKRINLFPSGNVGTFTIKGKITIQSDLTTAEREPAAGAVFFIDLYPQYNFQQTIEVKADANGNYSVNLPDWSNSSGLYGYFHVRYIDYTTNQKIAINRYSGEPSFPETLPKIVTLNTSFSPIGYGLLSIPSVQPIYAISPAPEGTGGVQASPFRLTPNGNGGINTGTFGISTGTGYTAGDKTLNIVSILGGSGAQGVIRDTNANGVLDQYQISTAGTGYPNSNNANVVGQEYFDYSYFHNNGYFYNSDSYRAGIIIVNNLHYGTGYLRTEAIN